MELQDLVRMPEQFITPAIAAKVTGQDPQELRLQARERPELLGYPVSVCGTRTKNSKMVLYPILVWG